MPERKRNVRAGNKMKHSLRPGASQLTLLSLLLLWPRDITSYPHPPTTLQPGAGLPQLTAALLQSAPGHLRVNWFVQPEQRRDPRLSLLTLFDLDVLLRAQREELRAWPLWPSPRGRHQERREGEDGGKRNEALTSIAGGLQAVSREKGGFGFRFGRKRWTGGGRMNEERGSVEEKMK